MDLPAIHEEISRLREILGDLEAEKTLIDRKMIPVREELQHWMGIVRLRGGQSDEASAPVPVMTFTPSEDGDGFVLAPPAEKYGEKARRMRQFVWENASNGITIRQLTEFTVQQLRGHQNMAYRWVARLLAADPPQLQKTEDGRIFPTQYLKRD